MESKRKLPNTAFLMIVTPRDFPLAIYTIPPLARLTASSPCLQAIVYCNGLSAQQVSRIAGLLRGYSRIILKDNSDYLQSIRGAIKIGPFRTESGDWEQRQGLLETAPEIWSRELVRLPTDFVTIIDPDFEIFDEGFIKFMLEEMAKQPKLAFYSTDYMPQHKTFETYSQQDAIIAERWNTWFCIYRRAALEKCHDFKYREELPIRYDHSAMLQKILIHTYGCAGRSLVDICSVNEREGYLVQFLHYGNFAQNRSLRGLKLSFYRAVRIGRHNGWMHRHHSILIAKIVRRLATAVWQKCRMDRFDAERTRYAYQMEATPATSGRP